MISNCDRSISNSKLINSQEIKHALKLTRIV